MNQYQSDHTQKPLLFELIRNHRNDEAKQHLESHPEEIHLKGWMDDTPLHIAALSDNSELVRYLLEHGAAVNARRSGVYRTPLCWAESVEVARMLLDHGATMNDEELYHATRIKKAGVVDLLLERGAKIDPENPQFTEASDIEVIRTYLRHGITIDAPDTHGKTLLHHLAWLDLPEVFDFAYQNGCPWQKDSSRRTPYILAKQGNRRAFLNHIETRYPELIVHQTTAINPAFYSFQFIHFLKQHPFKPEIFIGISESTNLLRFALRDRELILLNAVSVETPTVRNFTFDSRGNILLPTGENKLLLLDSDQLHITRIVELPGDIPLDQITYLPKKHLFIGSSNEWKFTFLDDTLQVLGQERAEDGSIFPLINPDENLVSFFSYDQETYFNLYRLDSKTHLEFIHTFFKDWDNSSSGFTFNGNAFAVSFPQVLEYYELDGPELLLRWDLDLSAWPSEHQLSKLVCPDQNTLILGKGKTLLFIDIVQQRVIREEHPELHSEIRALYLDDERKNLLISTFSEMKLVLLP